MDIFTHPFMGLNILTRGESLRRRLISLFSHIMVAKITYKAHSYSLMRGAARRIVAAAAANKDTVAQERSGSRFASITRPFAKKGLPLLLRLGGRVHALYYIYFVISLCCLFLRLFGVLCCRAPHEMRYELCSFAARDADGTQGEWEKLHAPVNTFGWKFCHEVELRNKKEFLCARRRPYFRLKETESRNILRARWFMCAWLLLYLFSGAALSFAQNVCALFFSSSAFSPSKSSSIIGGLLWNIIKMTAFIDISSPPCSISLLF